MRGSHPARGPAIRKRGIPRPERLCWAMLKVAAGHSLTLSGVASGDLLGAGLLTPPIRDRRSPCRVGDLRSKAVRGQETRAQRGSPRSVSSLLSLILHPSSFIFPPLPLLVEPPQVVLHELMPPLGNGPAGRRVHAILEQEQLLVEVVDGRAGALQVRLGRVDALSASHPGRGSAVPWLPRRQRLGRCRWPRSHPAGRHLGRPSLPARAPAARRPAPLNEMSAMIWQTCCDTPGSSPSEPSHLPRHLGADRRVAAVGLPIGDVVQQGGQVRRPADPPLRPGRSAAPSSRPGRRATSRGRCRRPRARVRTCSAVRSMSSAEDITVDLPRGATKAELRWCSQGTLRPLSRSTLTTRGYLPKPSYAVLAVGLVRKTRARQGGGLSLGRCRKHLVLEGAASHP